MQPSGRPITKADKPEAASAAKDAKKEADTKKTQTVGKDAHTKRAVVSVGEPKRKVVNKKRSRQTTESKDKPADAQPESGQRKSTEKASEQAKDGENRRLWSSIVVSPDAKEGKDKSDRQKLASSDQAEKQESVDRQQKPARKAKTRENPAKLRDRSKGDSSRKPSSSEKTRENDFRQGNRRKGSNQLSDCVKAADSENLQDSNHQRRLSERERKEQSREERGAYFEDNSVSAKPQESDKRKKKMKSRSVRSAEERKAYREERDRKVVESSRTAEKDAKPSPERGQRNVRGKRRTEVKCRVPPESAPKPTTSASELARIPEVEEKTEKSPSTSDKKKKRSPRGEKKSPKEHKTSGENKVSPKEQRKSPREHKRVSPRDRPQSEKIQPRERRNKKKKSTRRYTDDLKETPTQGENLTAQANKSTEKQSKTDEAKLNEVVSKIVLNVLGSVTEWYTETFPEETQSQEGECLQRLIPEIIITEAPDDTNDENADKPDVKIPDTASDAVLPGKELCKGDSDPAAGNEDEDSHVGTKNHSSLGVTTSADHLDTMVLSQKNKRNDSKRKGKELRATKSEDRTPSMMGGVIHGIEVQNNSEGNMTRSTACRIKAMDRAIRKSVHDSDTVGLATNEKGSGECAEQVGRKTEAADCSAVI